MNQHSPNTEFNSQHTLPEFGGHPALSMPHAPSFPEGVLSPPSPVRSASLPIETVRETNTPSREVPPVEEDPLLQRNATLEAAYVALETRMAYLSELHEAELARVRHDSQTLLHTAHARIHELEAHNTLLESRLDGSHQQHRPGPATIHLLRKIEELEKRLEG